MSHIFPCSPQGGKKFHLLYRQNYTKWDTMDQKIFTLKIIPVEIFVVLNFC